jgi:hypothetical protein
MSANGNCALRGVRYGRTLIDHLSTGNLYLAMLMLGTRGRSSFGGVRNMLRYLELIHPSLIAAIALVLLLQPQSQPWPLAVQRQAWTDRE